jgi:hypothetical protein
MTMPGIKRADPDEAEEPAPVEHPKGRDFARKGRDSADRKNLAVLFRSARGWGAADRPFSPLAMAQRARRPEVRLGPADCESG